MKGTGTSKTIWTSPPASDAICAAAWGRFTCHSSSR